MFDLPVGSTVKLSVGGVTRIDEVRAGGSYLSQHDRRLHFGVGSATLIDSIEITSSIGERRVVKHQPVNRVFRAGDCQAHQSHVTDNSICVGAGTNNGQSGRR
jgi:hypothetical protein